MYKIINTGTISVTNSTIVVILIYIIFVTYTSISWLWTPSVEYFQEKLIRLLIISSVVFIFPVIVFNSKKDFHQLLRVLLYAAIFVAITLIIGSLSAAYDRPYHLLGANHHIGVGRIIGIGIPISFYFLTIYNQRNLKLIQLMSICLLLIGIFVSGSRGPLIAAVVSSAVFLSLVLSQEISKIDRPVFGFLIGTSILTAISIQEYTAYSTLDRILPLLRDGLDNSIITRIELASDSIIYWANTPIIGSGFGSFGILRHGSDIKAYPHNFFLEILVELGLIGILLFILIILYSIKSVVKNKSNRGISALIICLLIYAVINSSLSFDLPTNRLLFFVIGLSISSTAWPQTSISFLNETEQAS